MAESIQVVPGVPLGEGCSLTGGCASCPYMKMNTLSALQGVCRMVAEEDRGRLAPHAPKLHQPMPGGGSVAAEGCVPILHMRHFQAKGRLSDELVAAINGHAGGPAGAAGRVAAAAAGAGHSAGPGAG